MVTVSRWKRYLAVEGMPRTRQRPWITDPHPAYSTTGTSCYPSCNIAPNAGRYGQLITMTGCERTTPSLSRKRMT